MPAEKLLYVIGIDKYIHPFHRKLKNAVLDATRFAGILQDRYGYRLIADPLIDEQATLINIRKGLAQISREASNEDSVIIYYAGHGVQDPHSKTGYWVPYDSNDESYTYLDHSTILNEMRKITSRHVMLISDSCYSGTFISQTRGSSMVPTIDELESMASRWIYVSGDEEKVPDGELGKGSPYTKSLCDFLQENIKLAVPAYEVFDAVTRMTKELSRQDPQSEPMRYGHDGGQIVFRLTSTEIKEKPLREALTITFPLPENPALEYYMPRSLSSSNPETDFWDLHFDRATNRNYLDILLETKRKLVVLGTAGTGKSIELQYRAAQWNAYGNGRCAIFARFNTYTNQDISKLLPEGWVDIPPNDLCIFLDGLDEIQPSNFHTAVRKVSEFQQSHPAIGIVISCRTNFYELPVNGFSGTLPEFDVYYLNDISYSEIIKHAKEKYGVDGEVFLAQVHKYAFDDLVQKPFFLRVLLEHYKRNNSLEIKRTVIMETALIEGYMGNKEHFYSTGQVLSKPHTFALLEKIAFVMEVMGKNFISDDDLQTLFPVPADFEQCKYLPAFSRDDNKQEWSFDHNNIQEYLASRVLSRQPFDKLISLISSEIGDETKIKPSWVNTLSFLISTGERELVDKLMAWLVDNDREVIIRFEPDRVAPEQRKTLFRTIYEYYRTRGIWMHSNKFSDKDLALFGASEDSLKYLIEQLKVDDTDRNNILNAMALLRHYPLSKYPKYKDIVKDAILNHLDNTNLTAQDQYSVINTLDALQFNDRELVGRLVERFGGRKNQYLRAGLYNIIQHSEASDEFLQVYLDGLELDNLGNGLDDRETVNLMDESFSLTRGISSLKAPSALSKLFDVLASNKSTTFFHNYDLIDIFNSLIDSSIAAFDSENRLYDSILSVLQSESSHYYERITEPLLRFLDATGNRYRALLDTWSNQALDDYEKFHCVKNLIDEDSLTQLTKHLVDLKDEESLKKLHLEIFFNFSSDQRDKYLQIVEDFTSKQMGLSLERHVIRDWTSIQRQRSIESFDLLFDVDGLKTEVLRVFKELGKDELAWDDLYSHRSSFDDQVETRFNGAALLIIRELMRGTKKASQNSVTELFDSAEFTRNFRFQHIHAMLKNQSEIQPTAEQIEQIRLWCISHPEYHREVWFLLTKFNFALPEEQILNLSRYPNYSNETDLHVSGHLEQLEVYLVKEKLHTQVIKNLSEPVNYFTWITNAGYALRHHIQEAYPLIKAYLIRGEDNYSLDNVLMFWFETTLDLESLKELATKLPPSHLRWRAIRILEEQTHEREFIKSLLTKIMNEDGDINHQDYAASHLLKFNDLNALAFLLKRIITTPASSFDYRIKLGNASCLTDINAIPILIELLLFANGPDHIKDSFNSLESPIISALFNIGTTSTENFFIVKDALNKVIAKYEQTMPQLRYLYYHISNMEEQLRKKESDQVNIKTAINEFNRFSS